MSIEHSIATEQQSRRRQIMADVALLLVTLIWGSTFVMVKDVVSGFPVYRFLTIRFALATLALIPLSARRLISATKRQIGAGVLIGLCLFAGYAFQTTGLKYTTASKAGFITGLSVVLVPLLSTLLLRGKPTWQATLGVILSTAGLAVLSLNADLSVGQGDLLVLGCAISFALHIVAVSAFAPRMDPLILSTVQVATVAVISGIAFLLQRGWASTIPMPVWGAAAFTGVLATAVAFGVQNAAQRFTSPTHTAIIFTAEPVFAALFGYLLGGEQLAPRMMSGGALIVAGMIAGEMRWTQNLARWASRLFNLPTLSIPILAIASFRHTSDLAAGVTWFGLTTTFSVLIPILILLWELHRGGISDWDISDRRQRLKPSLIGAALVGALVPLGAIIVLSGPMELLAVYTTGLVLVLLSLSITSVWKISQHALSIGTATTMLCAFLGPLAAPVFLLIPLTAWSRVRLGAHSPRQVLAGIGMGVCATLVCFRVFDLV